jgi:S1-C subfamily serine protease
VDELTFETEPTYLMFLDGTRLYITAGKRGSKAICVSRDLDKGKPGRPEYSVVRRPVPQEAKPACPEPGDLVKGYLGQFSSNYGHTATALVGAVLATALSACSTTSAPSNVERPTTADFSEASKATVLMSVVDASMRGGWSGTGWFVDHPASWGSWIVTAGHVCAGGAIFTARTYDGDECNAQPYVVEDEGSVDVCVLRTDCDAPAELPLSGRPTSTLTIGEPAWYVGYPGGHLAAVDGRISGIDDYGYLLASTPGWFGSSGSALLAGNGEVVGVLSAMGPANASVLLFSPVEYVHEALDIASAF